MSMWFTVTARDKDTLARTGILSLAHGDVETPAFMPVGTNGSVKAIAHQKLEEMRVPIILGNTYHLYLRPGIEVIDTYGGLHQFSSWNGNILTDSGGFQVFSLAPFREITEQGVRFRSHIDGSYHELSPEKVIRIQNSLNSDISMVLDVCTPPEIQYNEALKALKITTAWAKRSLKEWRIHDPAPGRALFPILQGNFYKDLRQRSAEELLALDFPGVAVGGLSVGEPFPLFLEMLHHTGELLPPEKPHYLMGIGTPEYILAAVENSIDLFDCVFPTRIARNGSVFTPQGVMALKKAEFEKDTRPIMEDCNCLACRRYSRAYIRHLFKAKEILGPMLTTEHNIQFMLDMTRDIRTAIRNSGFRKYKEAFLDEYRGKHT
jgi:queuine tRNA-ribosyltransferase